MVRQHYGGAVGVPAQRIVEPLDVPGRERIPYADEQKRVVPDVYEVVAPAPARFLTAKCRVGSVVLALHQRRKSAVVVHYAADIVVSRDGEHGQFTDENIHRPGCHVPFLFTAHVVDNVPGVEHILNVPFRFVVNDPLRHGVKRIRKAGSVALCVADPGVGNGSHGGVGRGGRGWRRRWSGDGGGNGNILLRRNSGSAVRSAYRLHFLRNGTASTKKRNGRAHRNCAQPCVIAVRLVLPGCCHSVPSIRSKSSCLSASTAVSASATGT
ncbi:hypothetical protein SDC9_78111 [bioreactor metagenome]|uniref:Uncharacterized protein n=1 Tax=bioreactor metagenome TaxID=1076179 RepID=A0A644YSS1_9ZZZZ